MGSHAGWRNSWSHSPNHWFSKVLPISTLYRDRQIGWVHGRATKMAWKTNAMRKGWMNRVITKPIWWAFPYWKPWSRVQTTISGGFGRSESPASSKETGDSSPPIPVSCYLFILTSGFHTLHVTELAASVDGLNICLGFDTVFSFSLHGLQMHSSVALSHHFVMYLISQ